MRQKILHGIVTACLAVGVCYGTALAIARPAATDLDLPVEQTEDAKKEVSETMSEPEGEETAVETEETPPAWTETPVTPYVMYAQTSLNVRSGPDVSFERLFTLPVNEQVSVTAKVDNGWVAVTAGEQSGYCNKTYLGMEEVAVEETSNVSTVIDGALVRENCSDAEWNAAIRYWNQVPSGLRRSFAANNWQMIVTNNNFWTSNGYSSLAGLTLPDAHVIYIHASHMRKTTVGHEMCHYLDMVQGWPSQSVAFADLFAQERGSFTEYDSRGDQSKQNVTEYFAAVACQLFVAPETESSAPQSFAYVRQYMLW